MTLYAEKLLPHDIEAEEAVLGAALIDGELTGMLAGRLAPEDFYREKHSIIWAAMVAVHRQRRAVDQITVARQLADLGKLESAGGMAYLSHLVAVTPTSANAAYYADIVIEKRRGRGAICIASRIVAELYDGGDSARVVTQAVADLLTVHNGDPAEPQSVSQLYDRLQGDLLEEVNGVAQSLLRARPTGYHKLNQMINGWEDGLLYLLGARTSMGKTLVALNLALRAAEQGYKVLLFSLELSSAAVFRRLASSLARFDRYTNQRLSESQRDRNFALYSAALDFLDTLPIWISDRRGLRPIDIQSIIARHTAEHGAPDLVVIDYLNLVKSDKPSRSRYESMTDTVNQLKDIGGNMSFPLLLAAQFSRAPEGRPESGKRPTLADFRDSGAIEEVASVAMALYRPAYYYPTEDDWRKAYGNAPWPERELEIIILKNQEGPVGKGIFQVDTACGLLEEAPDAA